MPVPSKYNRFFISIAILWMTVFPILSVCGMMADATDAKAVIPVSCCPTESAKNAETTPKKLCHPLNDAKNHSCEVCPCEFKSSMITVKSVSMIVPESQELQLPVFETMTEELFTSVDSDSFFPRILQNISPHSGPPTFIRNCTWLI